MEFGKWAVQTEQFRSGKFDTKFIDKYFKPEYLNKENVEEEQAAALLAAFVWEKDKKENKAAGITLNTVSKWKLNRQ